MNIRRAIAGDEAVIRGLRVHALSDAPEDFDSTLDRELARTAAEWRRFITDGATFILEHDGEPRGVAAGVPHDTDPAAIFLVSMWVHPEQRGTGAADALITAVITWARAEGFTDMWLDVVETNRRARRCYERNGFRNTGNEVIREPSGRVEVEMRRPLAPRNT